VQPEASKLQLTVRTKLSASASLPPDAFEIALLDTLGNSLAGLTGLNRSDAAFNVQANGTVRKGDKVHSDEQTGNGFVTHVVTFDISNLEAGSQIMLYLDLLGFGALDSVVYVDDISIDGNSVEGNRPPVGQSFTGQLEEDTVDQTARKVAAVVPRLNLGVLPGLHEH